MTVYEKLKVAEREWWRTSMSQFPQWVLGVTQSSGECIRDRPALKIDRLLDAVRQESTFSPKFVDDIVVYSKCREQQPLMEGQKNLEN